MSNSKINIDEAAQILNTTPLNILMHIKRGLMVGCEEEGGWVVQQASLESFIEQSGGVKVADVCASSCAKKHACGGGCS